MKADDGLPVQIPRTFAPLSGTPANLAVTSTSQAVTLTQVIPAGGCNVRIACTGVACHIRFDGTAATTSDLLMLAGTVEVFTLAFGASITAILDSGSSGGNLNVTLGMGA
jgi:hypothetical protein